MRFSGRDITNYLHKRNCAVLVAILATAAIIVAYNLGAVDPIAGDRGIIFPSPNLWIGSPTASLAINLLMIAGLASVCIAINKTFNIMRAQTASWATFFLFSMMALPSPAGQFYGGTLLCAVIVGATVLLFTCYGRSDCTRRVFLMFFMVTMTATVQYGAMFYLPVLFVGLMQMRILNMKSVIAALFGIVTPIWIMFGCGIVDIDDVEWPQFVGTLGLLDATDMAITFSAIGFTVLLGIMAMCGVLMKVVSYNAKYRSANGFWAVVMIATILLLLVDYNNLAIYIPLLDFTVAYHLAHFFSNHRNNRSYIGILSIIAVYILFYVLATRY